MIGLLLDHAQHAGRTGPLAYPDDGPKRASVGSIIRPRGEIRSLVTRPRKAPDVTAGRPPPPDRPRLPWFRRPGRRGDTVSSVAGQVRPHSVESLRHVLRALGVGGGDVVLMHSSKSSLGFVAGGPQAVVQAALDAVGPEGTLVVPTHPPE